MKKIIILAVILILLVLPTFASDLSIVYSVADTKIPSGGSTTLSLTISSLAGTGYIKMYATPGSYLSLNNAYMESGGLSAGGIQQFSFIVTASNMAPSMTSYVNFVIKYSTTSGEKESHITVPIKIRNEPDFQISDVAYDTDIIEPGKTVNMNFILMNNGKGAAKNVKIILNQSFFTANGSGEKFINSIAAGSGVNISVQLSINPDKEPGNYLIPITLNYNDETELESYTVSKNIGIRISGAYIFLISKEEQNNVHPGSKGSFIIKIANAGKQDAQFSILKILESEQFYDFHPSETYIGKIRSDDSESEEIEFYTKAGTLPGKYNIPVQLIYKDIYGNENTENANIEIIVSTKTSQYSITTIAIVLILIGASVWYFKFRKSKKLK